MREVQAELELALTHLHTAQKRLNTKRQSGNVIRVETLIATAGAITRTARNRVWNEKEETCEKS